MIYLATPYSSENKSLEEYRFKAACIIAGHFIARGMFVFSPIAHDGGIRKHSWDVLPSTWDYWEKADTDMITRSDKMYVAMLPGWDTSVGVQAEIQIARKLNKPVHYINLEYITKTIGINEFTK